MKLMLRGKKFTSEGWSLVNGDIEGLDAAVLARFSDTEIRFDDADRALLGGFFSEALKRSRTP